MLNDDTEVLNQTVEGVTIFGSAKKYTKSHSQFLSKVSRLR